MGSGRLSAAAARLAAAGVASPRVDAELLLAHVLGVPRGRLALATDLTATQEADFQALLARRANREPLQYLLGTAAFRYLELAVGPGVFIPRPETELLVDPALSDLRAVAAPLLVDLCAGSGALGLSVAAEVPDARVVLVERDPAALVWLRRNAEGTSVTVVAADITAPGLLAELDGRVDVVLSNPPYVPAATPVGPEVAQDPPQAVFAGPDGLDLMPSVSRLAARLLRPRGLLAVEHDDTQGESVPRLLRADGWTQVVDHPDLAGRPRYATARR